MDILSVLIAILAITLPVALVLTLIAWARAQSKVRAVSFALFALGGILPALIGVRYAFNHTYPSYGFAMWSWHMFVFVAAGASVWVITHRHRH